MFVITSMFHSDIIPGERIDLLEEVRYPASGNSDLPCVEYGIYLHHTHIRIGYCDLRVGMNEELYYAGNIGYRIDPFYRGNGYAYEAVKLLFSVARDTFAMHTLLITCSPDNIPSRKTLEKLGGRLVDETPVPKSHWLYQRGETFKNIYRYDL